MSSKPSLTKFINQSINKARAAETHDGIHQVARDIAEYGPLKYNFLPWFVLVGILVSFALIITVLVFSYEPSVRAFSQYSMQNGHDPFFMSILWIASPLLVSGVIVAVVAHLNSKINTLTSVLLLRDALMDYELRPVKPLSIKYLEASVGDFRRGNHSRSINDCYEGRGGEDRSPYPFTAFRFHYVDKETRRTSKNGKTTTETVYLHYDRSGLVLPFEFLTGVHVAQSMTHSFYNATFTSASIRFNNLFLCRSETDQAAAMLLKPAVVEALSDAAEKIRSLTVEISLNNKMYITCEERHILDPLIKVEGDPATDPRINPRGFYELILGHSKMPHLDALLELADTLIRFSDSNFKRRG
jgi:hypothetical protein